MSEMSYQEIQDKIAELTAQAEALKKQEQASAIQTIAELMLKFDITTADLDRKLGKRLLTNKARRQIQPKYRDPATGALWSGMGRKPRWMTAALESGRKQEEFLIDKS